MKLVSLPKLKWQITLLSFGILAIGLHFVCKLLWPYYENWPLLLTIFIGGVPLLWQILVKLYKKNLGADVLALISIVTAFILGQYLACVLIILMLATGQTLETIALDRAASVLQALADRMPSRAQIRRGNKIIDIDISEIKINDILVIAPHKTSPVDGIVIEGFGFMDESYLTGEPYRIAKAKGSQVLSGAINGETMLLVQALKLPKDSRYAQIMKVMEEAEQKRPKMRRLSDQLGAIFAPLSLLLAVGAWIYSLDPIRFLSVLVIATPCPLLIAIPVALISSISMAARRGIIIKDPVVLERLPTCTTAIFDKTGTLTYGQPSLTEIFLNSGFLKNDVLRKVASLEQYSKHPLSQAIIDSALKANLLIVSASEVSEIPNKGLVGIIEGSKIAITGREKILKEKPELESILPPSAPGLECIILIDGVYAATMRFRDTPRIDSERFVSHLAPFHSFKKVMLLSGDRESEVSYLAKTLGIKESYSSKTPEQKLKIVQDEVKIAPTLFMGDGINDAPALRAATVGLAFGQPTEVAREAGGAVIMENSLAKVDELLHISKNMRVIALISAVGGMTLSLIGMVFAALGFISPVAGALLQQGIDAVAIINALQLTFKRDVKIDLPL